MISLPLWRLVLAGIAFWISGGAVGFALGMNYARRRIGANTETV